jgi:hypothetical protein
VAAIAQPAQDQAPDGTWITEVRIISPEKLDHIEKGSVLIGEIGQLSEDFNVRSTTPKAAPARCGPGRTGPTWM